MGTPTNNINKHPPVHRVSRLFFRMSQSPYISYQNPHNARRLQVWHQNWESGRFIKIVTATNKRLVMASVVMVKGAILKFFQSFFKQEHQLSSRQRWILGLVNLSSVVIFWVLSSFLVNDLFETDVYRKPFFITYINTSCFIFYLVPYFKYEGISTRQFIRVVKLEFHNGYRYIPLEDDIESGSQGPTATSYGSNDNLPELTAESLNTPKNLDFGPELNIGIYDTIKLALQFIILWFSANLVTNASLSYTSVASQTILSTTSSFFTLLIGYLYSIENINQNKILGIVLSFTGVIIVTKIDAASEVGDPASNNNWLIIWGNLLALSGALIYGIYTILLKFRIRIKGSTKERNLNTHLFFGFVGIYCVLGLWPVIIILHFTKVETFELPPSGYIITLLSINAFITFISDFCWCKAVLLTSPLTVTVGLSMTIPLAMVGDWILKGFDVHVWYVFGAVIVTLGFLVINKDEQQDFVEE